MSWLTAPRVRGFVLLPLGLVGLLVVAPWTPPDLEAQVRPVYSQGAAGVLQDIERLQTTASALHTATHPDDEDTAFMARVARGDHARVAYLALNRGEGGQNIIGPELSEALGVIRTEELLQARALDGGDQFFTRTFDFGFSKTEAEAAAKWDAEDVLADMVRIIRLYRPLVVYSGFSGTTADGHGQHQLAGTLTPIAFRAAADPARFPAHFAEGLRPWQAKKLYVRHGFRIDPANPPSLRLETGRFDALLGRTYFEIAMEGRSQHKTQQMGVPELKGPQASGLRLLETLAPRVEKESSVFDGIDTTLTGLPALAGLPAGTLQAEMNAVQEAVARALSAFDPRDPRQAVPHLADALRGLRAARAALAAAGASQEVAYDADFLLGVKESQCVRALRRASGLVIDPVATDETVAPGETLGVTVRVFQADPATTKVGAIEVVAPEGWAVRAGQQEAAPSSNPMARFFRETPERAEAFTVSVPGDARVTEPYWLRLPRKGDQFVWPVDAPKGLPFAPPLLAARAAVEIGGVPLTLDEPVEYRLVDRVRGELRRNVEVVPAVSVGFDARLEVVPLASLGQPRRVAVRLGSGSATAVEGRLRLLAPEGWTVSPAEAAFTLPRKGDRTAAVFTLVPRAGTPPGAYRLRAEAVVGASTFGRTEQVIAYPHIQTHRMYQEAEAQVRVLDLRVSPVRVGYVMGSGDQVPDAIRRMGLEVTMLDADHLASGDLARFDTIVVGIRASETRPDFVASHGRLLAYVREGGTLIVQYQQPDYVQAGLPPFPAQMSARVTVEEAPVTVLAPDHPAFTQPNRIGEADWSGWVQERNLYAFTTFDPQYTALLESADPGEAPNQGGQVVTRLGKGTYVYTAYSWFRQLPAGVPGAYRLFANLLSLSKTVPPPRP
jgi:LmbE family N-acetylglucosaminyl deacetylase